MEHPPDTHERVRVLIVDDDDGIRLLLQSILSAPRFDAVGTANAADALRLARAESFDAILLDRFLPEVDAVQIIPTLRAAAPAAALVLLSAVDDVDARVAALRSGADDFLTKPFELRVTRITLGLAFENVLGQ